MKKLKSNKPLVSIGIPVFNGEKSIGKALNSLINQDYENIEIIISDNASTDKTFDICKKFILKDSRIKYNLLPRNIGGILNFNRTFKLSSGKYFLWAAHDDTRDKSFISKCLSKMEKNLDIVLCHSYTNIFIENHKTFLCTANLDSFRGISGTIPQYKKTLQDFPAVAIYGLIRSSAMRKTQLMGKFLGGDIVFINELSLYGKFDQVPSLLFNYFARKKWNNFEIDYYNIYNKKKPWWYIPFIILFYHNCKRILNKDFFFFTKCHLLTVLVQNEIKLLLIKILVKIIKYMCPNILKKKVGSFIYWHLLHNKNMKKIGDNDLFFHRVIMHKFQWDEK
jgi:glycosyltransferase involved in cell wall biosynthesis